MKWTYALTSGVFVVWAVLLWFETGALFSYILAALGVSVAVSGVRRREDADAEA